MGRFIVIAAIIVALAIVAAIFLTRRWRDKQLLRTNPLALEKRGLDRAALLQLDANRQEIAQLRQALGEIAGNLEQALGDNIVTMWGEQTQQSVEHAYRAARQHMKEQ